MRTVFSLSIPTANIIIRIQNIGNPTKDPPNRSAINLGNQTTLVTKSRQKAIPRTEDISGMVFSQSLIALS
jgi:hypothetical protein